MSDAAQHPTPDELLDAAIRYAKSGLKIYPVLIPGLKPDGKKDARPGVPWKTAATDDLDTVRKWWTGRFSGYGIGVDMGRSGLAVADADVKDGVDGIDRMVRELAGERTALSHTPSGGLHAWYRDAEGRMGSGANIFGSKDEPSGVDGRGVGGTIFLPPTYVPGYGQYRWGGQGEPDWNTLPEVPQKLADACPPGGRKPATPATNHPPAPAVQDESQLFAAPTRQHAVAADQLMTRERAQERLLPLWEAVRDTHSPNGVWQAVADFARQAAHYGCFWDEAAVGRMVLAAYEAGNHGYTQLDGDDLRAIAGGYARQREAREAGDLDAGWEAIAQVPAEMLKAGISTDAVDALLAEMLTPGQLKERPRKPYLIKGLLNADSEAWLIGAPGSRKSFVALDMAGHIAAGRDWQGLKVRQAGVVIIAAEGAGGMGDRVRAWEREHGQMPDAVRILPRPVQSSDAAAWMTLVRACERLQPGLVIADTQARVTVGLEENSATDMGIFINAVSALRTATGACVLAVHHTGRSGGDARGSSAIDGAQDTELKVVADGQPLRGQLRVEKQKDLPEGEPIPLMFKLHVVGVDDDGDPVTSLALAGQDAWLSAETAPEPPEEWETGHAVAIVQLFKVLRDQGGQRGLTKAEARNAVVELFYGGDPKALKRSTWYTAWDRGQEKRSASGDPVMVNLGGARWSVDAEALTSMPARD